MTPVFALLVAFLAFDVLVLVAPYFAYRYTNDAWGSAERMEFLAKAMASALAFGLVSAIAAERRNRSPWAFLLGHCGYWLALALAAKGWDVDHPRAAPMLVISAGFAGCVLVILFTRAPREAPPRVDGALRAICRLTGLCGNIWFGIALMAAIAFSVGVGTIIESMYVTAQVAQHYVYRAAWFGAIFFTAGLSMLSATLRKWPFRLEQAGWLTVHSGLALVVIGSMVSFLTKVEGNVSITEGSRVDAFDLDTRTRLTIAEVIEQPGGRKRLLDPMVDAISDFDVNPAEKQPGRVFKSDREPLSITVDRYFATGIHQTRWHDDAPESRAAITMNVFEGSAKKPSTVVRLDEVDDATTTLDFGRMKLPIDLQRATPKLLEAVLRQTAAPGLGKVVVRDAAGKSVLELPVEAAPGAETRPEGSPAALATPAAPIPGTAISVRLRGYFDLTMVSGGHYVDASPGLPWNPSVAVTLDGAEGEDTRQVGAFTEEPPPKGRYPYELAYLYEPAIRIPGPRIVIVAAGGSFDVVYFSADGTKTVGDVEVGAPLPLPMPFLKLVPTGLYRNLRVEDDYSFESYEPRNPVIRITPAWDGVAGEPLWVPLHDSRVFVHDERQFVVSWRSTARTLGFSLGLYDFHRDFHPGSRTPATFESYLRLVHPVKFPDGEDIKIDMNHPLRLDGWRLFQSRFDEAARPGAPERTILQVNRDPGLALTYPACAVVLLGLIVVLFMKKTLLLLRRKLEAERAPAARHVLLAMASVAAVGVGPAIFSVYVALRPWAEHHGVTLPLSGWPAFVFGLSLVAIVPIMVVTWFTRSLHHRLAAAAAPPATSGPS
jgi:hypothetical protein